MDPKSTKEVAPEGDPRPIDVDASSGVHPQSEEKKDGVDPAITPSPDSSNPTANLSTPQQGTQPSNGRVQRGKGKSDDDVRRTSSQASRDANLEQEEVILEGSNTMGSSTLLTSAATVPLATDETSSVTEEGKTSADGVPSAEADPRSTHAEEAVFPAQNPLHDGASVASEASENSIGDTKRMLSMSNLDETGGSSNAPPGFVNATRARIQRLELSLDSMHQDLQQSMQQNAMMLQQHAMTMNNQMQGMFQQIMNRMQPTLVTKKNETMETKENERKTTGLSVKESVDGLRSKSEDPKNQGSVGSTGSNL